MPSIAQQDYNRIYITDVEALTSQEKQAMQKAVDNGVIMDTIIELPNGISRIIASDASSKHAYAYDFVGAGVVTIDYSE